MCLQLIAAELYLCMMFSLFVYLHLSLSQCSGHTAANRQCTQFVCIYVGPMLPVSVCIYRRYITLKYYNIVLAEIWKMCILCLELRGIGKHT
jgi:hypothetical protein